jgi:hypothetical protein
MSNIGPIPVGCSRARFRTARGSIGKLGRWLRNHPADVSVRPSRPLVSKFKGENFNKQSLTGVGYTGSMRAALLMVALLALAIFLDAYFYGGFYGQAAARMISQIRVHFL